MDSSNLTRRRHGEEGNVAVAVAVLLALVVAAGFFVLFYLRVQNVSPATPSGVPSTSPVSPLDESQDPGGLRELPVVEVGDGEATAPEDPEPEPTDKGLRIHGKVTNPDGKGVAGALVRYMPGPAFLRRNIRNDLIVLSDSEETELVFQPEAGVSIPSVSARTDAEGAYELHIEPGGREGGLIAHAQGHTMEKRELADHLPQADPEIPSPQEAAEEGEPLQPQEARINFVLEPGGSISGAVTVRATGAPAAGMIVRAVKIEPGTPARFQLLRGNAPSASVHSEGAYSIGGLEPGDYRVFPMTGSSDFVGISPRQATPVLLLQGSQVTGIDFEVARGGAISGQVSSAQGDPIEGATVRLLPANFMQAAMRGDLDSFAPGDEEGHTTGEDGGYRISGVPFESEFSVLAGARGHAPAGERSVKVTEEHPERRVDLIVTRGSTISGTAFFEDETLAPETPVMLMPDLQEIMSGSSALLAFNDGVNSVTTDARGNFMIEHLPAGSYNISAGEGIAYNPFGGGGAAVVEVDGIHDVTGVEVTVTRAAEPGEPAGEGTITGRVMDDQGMPLEKVEVSASSMEPGVAWSSSVKTDAEGRFQVVGYRATTGRLRASLKGYAPKRLTLTGAEENLTIVLDRAGTIAGRVVAADGAPPGTPFKVSVKEVLEGGGQGLMEEVMNRVGQGDRSWHTGDADGAFTLEDVPTGIVEVLVEAAGYAPAVSERISIVPAAHVAGIEIRVSEGATVTGKVTVGGTISVEGATVAIVPATKEQEMLMRMMPSFLRGGSEAVTTSDGIYEIRHLAPGRYTLSAQHPKYAPSNPVEIVLREDEVFTAPGLNLPQGSSVEGTVTEAGKPKPGIMVQAQGNAPMQMATTDAEGHYQITGLSAGEYMFIFVDMTQASSGGGMGLKTRALTVGEGEIITLDVAYGVGSKIHGTLAGLPAGPMRMVTLRRPGGPAPEDLDPTDIQAQIKAARFQAGIAMVTPDGAYVIPDVEPGEYILEVPRMPADPTDLQAYKEMDRTPLFREEITVGDTDLEINIEIDE